MKREPWHDCPNVFKDEKAYLNWLRSQIRRVWSRHPIKLEYKKKLRYKSPLGRNGKDVWVINCEMCNTPHRETQTDHLRGGFGFTDWQSFTDWSKMILWVTFDDIRELCPNCHACVTLSQKLGISLEDAKIEKAVIEIMKSKRDKEWLKEHGVTPASNAASRREQVREILNGKN